MKKIKLCPALTAEERKAHRAAMEAHRKEAAVIREIIDGLKRRIATTSIIESRVTVKLEEMAARLAQIKADADAMIALRAKIEVLKPLSEDVSAEKQALIAEKLEELTAEMAIIQVQADEAAELQANMDAILEKNEARRAGTADIIAMLEDVKARQADLDAFLLLDEEALDELEQHHPTA